MSIKFNNTILNYYENTNEIINIYMNQSKSKWLEIPLNQINSEYVSPFHFKIITDDILTILEYVEKVIFHLFKVDNSSAIILLQTRSKKSYRIIYPELLLTYVNEQRLISSLQQYIPIEQDIDTQLPYSGKYKCIGLYNQQVVIEEDFKTLCNLNGITFDQSLGQINFIVKKNETKMK